MNINVEKYPFGNVISRKTYINSRRKSVASMPSDLASIESDPSVIRQSVIVTKDENGNPIEMPKTIRSSIDSNIIIKDENGNLLDPDELQNDTNEKDDAKKAETTQTIISKQNQEGSFYLSDTLSELQSRTIVVKHE